MSNILTHDMNNIMTRVLTVIMLIIFSMGAQADVKVLFGEKGTELQPDKDGTITLPQKEVTGGTIIISQEDQKDGTSKVTFAVAPDMGYSMAEGGPEVYAVISPNGAFTRTPEVSTKLNLKSDDYKDIYEKRTYYVTIDSKLALWVKEARFQEKRRDSGAKAGGVGPVGTDFSGTFYISSNNKGNRGATTADRFYLCPSSDLYGEGEPFVTTNKTNQGADSKWKIVFNKTADDGKDYYHVIHLASNTDDVDKYLTYNEQLVSGNDARVRVHLQEGLDNTEGHEDYNLFYIAAGNVEGSVVICPKADADARSLNPAKNNVDGYKGDSSNSPGSFKNYDNKTVNCGGLIGLWLASDPNSTWFLEDVVPRPEILYDSSTDKISISCSDAGVTIYYTTNGSSPQTSGTEYDDEPFPLGYNTSIIKACATKDGNYSRVVTYDVPTCPTPVITYNPADGKITITCDGATIYYTKGIYPSDPTIGESSPLYSAPFDLGDATMVKAIAVKTGYYKSDIATFTNGLLYYIRNNNDQSYYLYPSTGDNPYVKTAKNQDADAVWQLLLASGGYYIKHFNDGKYMVADASALTNSVHLEATNPPGANAIFEITETAANSGVFTIKPKGANNSGSKNFLSKSGTGGSNISLAAKSDKNTGWLLVDIPIPPVIELDDINFTISSYPLGEVYYTIDGSDPMESQTRTKYTGKVTLEYGKEYPIRAYTTWTFNDNDYNSVEAATKTIQVKLAAPTLKQSGNTVTISSLQSKNIVFKYTSGTGDSVIPDPDPNEGGAGTVYNNTDPLPLTPNVRNVFKAIAYNIVDGTIYKSDVATFVVDLQSLTTISSLSEITSAMGNYIFGSGFELTGTPMDGGNEIGTSTNPFRGTIDGNFVEIALGSDPLFAYVEDATIKNIIVSSASVSNSSGAAGAIANVAQGNSRIYNCGVKSGSVSGGSDVGGIVGKLDGSSRVINCYSFATVSGGSNRGGIVGNNCYASKSGDLKTMVMNCAFYGNITGGGSPIYGGEEIENLIIDTKIGLNNYNYYSYENFTSDITAYNCALAVKEDYFKRYEAYRQLLNSNRKLAAWYVCGDAGRGQGEDNEMAKWVLETADRQISNPIPYPILKRQGEYPSIINYDAEHAPDSASVGRNRGGKVGTISVSINTSKTGNMGLLDWPQAARITNASLPSRVRTDKDEDRYNFNYDKIQLPYYNEVGEGNYTGGKVVTGWIITNISDGTAGTFSETDEYGGYNFADRKCKQKDLYSVSKRVFSQGAYYDVPYGVTGITIEPYWGNAAYVSDEYMDVVYTSDYTSPKGVLDKQFNFNNGTASRAFNGQHVYTTVSKALGTLSGSSVYDNAVVLVGNLHMNSVPSSGTKHFTIMSADLDHDNEPDYSLIYTHPGRSNGAVSPIRFDFVNVPGLAMAQKPKGAQKFCNVSIFKPKGWFEVTNTCIIRFSQFEYDNGSKASATTSAPVILLGGEYEQFVSTQSTNINADTYKDRTSYIHIGGNAYFKEFSNGTHSDGFYATKHIPISVTGGDFDAFYLSGAYRPDAQVIIDDDAECYISGGRFDEIAGAGQQQIDGNVHWQIYDADITDFYGGGVNAGKPITGNIEVDIINSHVTTYCGGPKFGDMQQEGSITITWATKADGSTTGSRTKTIEDDRTVTTNATGCSFDNYYGAGFGGIAYYRVRTKDTTNPDFAAWQNDYINNRGKYVSANNGIATEFDYEFFVWSTGETGGRFYVKYSSLSLAQTNDVTSTLKDCIINNNFYGGGDLGKVEGKATSTLTGCTVYGNVFGGGFSASKPMVKVRKAGFVTGKEPKVDTEAGVFDMGEKTGTDDFVLVSGTLTNNTSAIDVEKDPKEIFTDVNLDHLGQVNEVELTINGNSIIGKEGDKNTGHVYGGGDESAVNGDTKVTLAGKTEVRGNVFGGGNEGLVSGSATVNIEQ